MQLIISVVLFNIFHLAFVFASNLPVLVQILVYNVRVCV